MDVYFYHGSVTAIPFYNCSALTRQELESSIKVQRPVRGAAVFTVGFPMIIVYIACLKVMIKLDFLRKACYKIMFVLGLYEISALLINDVILAYVLVSGLVFCDAPNTFYSVGCFQNSCWAGVSYFCLYLSFNRILVVMKLRRHIIDFFSSVIATIIGVLMGIVYSLLFLFFGTPPIFSNAAGTPIPNPLGFEVQSFFEMRHVLLIINNCGVVVLTVIFYGIFYLVIRKKFKKLGFWSKQVRLQHQVFIQSTLMCAFNFSISTTYVFYLFFSEYIIVTKVGFFVYQFSSGLQALIYLLFNQAILDGVKDALGSLFGKEMELTTVSTKTTKNESTPVEAIANSVVSVR